MGSVAARQPRLPQRPTCRLANRAQHQRQRGIEVRGFVDRQRNTLQKPALLFRPLAFRDVADERDQPFASLQFDVRESDFDGQFFAFLAAADRLGRLLSRPAAVRLQIALQPLAMVGADSFGQ